MQNTARVDNDSLWRYGSGVLPDGTDTSMIRSPVINYAYERVRPILDRMKNTGDADKRHGYRLRYANPFNGGWSLPTMGANLSLLPKGFKGEPLPLDRRHHLRVPGRQGHDQGRRARPSNGARATCSWCRPGRLIRTRADQEAVLFSISDRPAQEALGIWREGN